MFNQLKESSSIEELENGQMLVEITYDFTKHGHNFSAPRHYSPTNVKALFDDKNVIMAIKNNYAKGYFGHQDRDPNKGYLPSETDINGQKVEPICRTTSVRVNGNFITHKQLIFNTENGIKAQKLIKNGGAGFSNAWDIKNKLFMGYDVVVSPNFAGNRVILDSVDDIAGFVLDSATSVVGEFATNEIKNIATELVMSDSNVVKYIKLQDKIASQESCLIGYSNQVKALKETIINNNTDTNNLNNDIANYVKTISQLESEALDNKNLSQQKQVEYDAIIKQLNDEKITVKDGVVKIDSVFGSIIKKSDFNLDTALVIPEIKLANKQDTYNKHIPFLRNMNLGYGV